ncbi:MAG TPA: HEAT repeat domain-containing protein [Terriglobales bacterium]|nr:HEAT repeat domain-containing protein [Terriglobales bacterium]
MLFIEDLGVLVLWLILAVMSINLAFIFFVFYRRLSRARYFLEKDSSRDRYLFATEDFAAGRIGVDAAFELLNTASSVPERDTIEELLLARTTDANAVAVSELFFALGYVDQWARISFGRRQAKNLVQRSIKREYADLGPPKARSWVANLLQLRILAVPRAIALDKLGRLAPVFAEVFLAEGLKDSSFYVRRVAIESLGRNRFPQAIPLLLEELRKSVEEGNDVSLRTMKAALIGYRLEDLDLFIPYITHKAPRMRFFVVDTFREICNRTAGDALLAKNDFSPSLCRVMIENATKDSFADVRARSAWVIRHFRDAQSKEALCRLMRDENEFVRLHAVRACGHRAFSELTDDVVVRLTDTRWRVREAAVSTLAKFGIAGLNEMYRFFISCPDAFACEQITEEIQRKGLVQDLVSTLAQGAEDSDLGRAVVQKMAMMEKTSLLINSLASITDPTVRVALMESLAYSPNEEFLAVLQMIAETSTGQVKSRASQILHQSSSNIQLNQRGSSSHA